MPNNHGTSEPDMEIIAEEIEVADTQICHKQQDNQNNVNRTDNDDEDHEGADLETRDCDDHHKSADLETRDIDDHHETTEAVENNEDKVVMEETVKSGFGGQKIIVRRRKRYMKQNDELKPLSEIIKPGKKLITVHGHRHPLPAVSGIHNELLQIGWLAGTWETHNGLCQYPTMEDFKYHQEVEFICIGQPMFNYVSKLSHPTRGTAMHQERGFLQIKPGTNQLEFMVSHNFGLTSLEQGHFNQFTGEIELATVSMTRMTFAEPPIILGFKRIIRYLGFNELQITIYMETEDTKLCKHLEAIYTKKS